MASTRLLYGVVLGGLALSLAGLVLFTSQESRAVLVAGLVLMAAGGAAATLALSRILAHPPRVSAPRPWAPETSELELPEEVRHEPVSGRGR